MNEDHHTNPQGDWGYRWLVHWRYAVEQCGMTELQGFCYAVRKACKR